MRVVTRSQAGFNSGILAPMLVRSRPFQTVLFLGVLGVASAQDAPIETGDPLELRRHARTIGEAGLLARIDAGEVQAIRAAGWAEAPEAVLQRLGEIAGGDDPVRAPAAARAGANLRLDPLDVEAREALPETLRAAREPWAALEADETARADLRRLAAIVRGNLDAALLQTPSE